VEEAKFNALRAKCCNHARAVGPCNGHSRSTSIHPWKKPAASNSPFMKPWTYVSPIRLNFPCLSTGRRMKGTLAAWKIQTWSDGSADKTFVATGSYSAVSRTVRFFGITDTMDRSSCNSNKTFRRERISPGVRKSTVWRYVLKFEDSQ